MCSAGSWLQASDFHGHNVPSSSHREGRGRGREAGGLVLPVKSLPNLGQVGLLRSSHFSSTDEDLEDQRGKGTYSKSTLPSFVCGQGIRICAALCWGAQERVRASSLPPYSGGVHTPHSPPAARTPTQKPRDLRLNQLHHQVLIQIQPPGPASCLNTFERSHVDIRVCLPSAGNSQGLETTCVLFGG